MSLIEYLCKEVVELVEHLHSTIGIAHSDIKPDNIIINDNFSLSFIDFGCSTSVYDMI